MDDSESLTRSLVQIVSDVCQVLSLLASSPFNYPDQCAGRFQIRYV